ncbi:MAG: glycosyltransferase family 39 protein [Ruminococcus sp.]|nr:glycosyltransferase family 39 protein [Ruminococcus sp.]
MTKPDLIALGVLFLISLLLAFIYLGNTSGVQTPYRTNGMADSFVIELEEPEEIKSIGYFGTLSVESQLETIMFSLEFSENGTDWQPYRFKVCPMDMFAVFYWKKYDFQIPINAKYFRFTAENNDYILFELAFFDTNGKQAAVKSVSGAYPGVENLCDEQYLVPEKADVMNSMYFDEIYHARTAYEHLNYMPYYEVTHPPLGKLIMSVGIKIFGMTPFGWRFTGALFGALLIIPFYMILKRLLKSTLYAACGTTVFVFDFMRFSLTRMATIDSYPTFFVLFMYYFMLRFCELALSYADGEKVALKEMGLWLSLSGIFMGLGCACKWTAPFAAVGLAIIFGSIMFVSAKRSKAKTKKSPLGLVVKTGLWCVIWFIVVPVIIYTLSYKPISAVYGESPLNSMMNNAKVMFEYHSQLTDQHNFASRWYTWPFVYKPLWAYEAPKELFENGEVGSIAIFPNPIISWLVIGAVLFILVRTIIKRDGAGAFLLVGFFSQFLAWSFISRVAFIYHYFGAYTFGIMLLIYSVKIICERFAKIKPFRYLPFALPAVSIVMFIIFYPILTGIPISKDYASFLRWFESWQFYT